MPILKLFSRLPLPLLYLLSPCIYFLLYSILGYRKAVIKANLLLAFPEKTVNERKIIEKGFYRHLSWLIIEIWKLMTMSEKEFKKRCTYSVSEDLQTEIKKGTSIIMLGSHLCNWEFSVYAPRLLLSLPFSTLYLPINQAFFHKMLYDIRSRFEMQPISMKTALREIVKRKHEVCTFGFASDQSPHRGMIDYYHTFFGYETPFATGAEKIAQKLQYPIMYQSVRRIRKGYYHYSFELLSAPPYTSETTHFPIMEEYIKRIERDISDNPSHWLWSHRRWKHAKTPQD